MTYTIDTDYLGSTFNHENFTKSTISKYDYSLINSNKYSFLGLPLSELYANKENGKISSFKVKMFLTNEIFYAELIKSFGKPRGIRFIDESEEKIFKSKFKLGLIKNSEDFSFNKIKTCFWYLEDVLIHYSNLTNDNLSNEIGLELRFSFVR